MKYTRTYETHSHDLDPYEAFMPTPLIQYLQETAEHQIRDTDKDYADIYREDRKAFIVSRMSVEIYRPIYKFATVDCDTWIITAKAANFPRMYELFVDGESVARASSNWALVNVDTKKLVKQGEYDISSYPMDEEPELQIPTRFRIPKDMELTEAGVVPVSFSLTDINGHMNNARYYNCLADCMPELGEYALTSMNMRFVHEAPLGKEIKIYRSGMEEPGKMDPRADKVVYFKTKVDGEDNIHAVFGLKHR